MCVCVCVYQEFSAEIMHAPLRRFFLIFLIFIFFYSISAHAVHFGTFSRSLSLSLARSLCFLPSLPLSLPPFLPLFFSLSLTSPSLHLSTSGLLLDDAGVCEAEEKEADCFFLGSFFPPFSRLCLDDAGVCEAEEKAD